MIVAITFGAFLALFAGVGLASSRRASDTSEDYLLAGRSVGPFATALSAVSTNHSGFMFVGLIGYAYTRGLEAGWLMAGWFVGDLLAFTFVHPRFERLAAETEAGSYLEMWAGVGAGATWVRRLGAAAIVLFLAGYAAAQLRATGVAVAGAFEIAPEWGLFAGALLIVAYSMAGGLRASIWTDTAQAIVMVLAMVLLVGLGLLRAGGPAGLAASLHATDASLLNALPATPSFGYVPWALGFVAGGFGVVGQPHVMVRFMSVRDAAALRRSRVFYLAWYAAFSAAAVLAGLLARALVPGLSAAAAESALPVLARNLGHPSLVGILLAGMVAATLSTADSQVLACSASLTQDLTPRFRDSRTAAKLATLGTTCAATLAAWLATGSVFDLVLGAWGFLAVLFGPAVVARARGRRPPAAQVLASGVIGLAAMLGWSEIDPRGDVYRVLPGLLAGAVVLMPRLGSEQARRPA